MKLRKLAHKDIPRMLEWMHDDEVNRFFQFEANSMTPERVAAFVDASQDDSENLHLACVNDADEYLGTISLKNIDAKNKNGEYAVVFRKDAQGTGAARYATQEILRIAFEERGLHKVYLNVFSDNSHAIHFYEQAGFVQEGLARQHVHTNTGYKDLLWFSIIKE